MANYNALLIGLNIVRQLGEEHLEAYRNSKLITNQVKEEYEVNMITLYLNYREMIKIADSFYCLYIDHVPRHKGNYADSLISLAATLALLAKSGKRITRE